MSDLKAVAEELVRSRIKGTRKGSDEPAYLHSFRVGDALATHGYGEDIVLAGLLHDVIEDSDTTEDELRSAGFSNRTVELVLLCTHDDLIDGGDARWICMMARLIRAEDPDAWAIKVADIKDNLRSCHTMPIDRCTFMREAKGPFLLNISEPWLKDQPLWLELKRELEA